METLRVGMIGAGGISRVHAAGWTALGAQVRVLSAAGAGELAAEYGFSVAESFDDLEGCDLVDIVTPTATHAPLAREAIGRGMHVICEKPLAATAAEADELVRAATAAGVRLFPAHVVRYFPEYAALRRIVEDGRIGAPAVLRFTRGGEAPAGGSWFFDENAGGGIVRDQMIHDLDQALLLAGPVAQVYAVQSPRSVGGRSPACVTAQVQIQHRAGAITQVQGTWGPPGMVFRTTAHIAGPDGAVGVDSAVDAPSVIELPGGAGGGYLPPPRYAESPYTAQLRDFVASIRTGARARVTAQDGVRALVLAEAAMHSLRTGETVTVAAEASA